MKHTQQTILALLATIAVAGIVPTTVSADPNCQSDFTIPGSKPLAARTIASAASEIGEIDVGFSASVDITVELATDEDQLEFVVYYLDGLNCVKASGTSESTCADPVSLDTAGSLVLPPQSHECTLEPPSSGTRTYFVGVMNKGSSDLDFRAWNSS